MWRYWLLSPLQPWWSKQLSGAHRLFLEVGCGWQRFGVFRGGPLAPPREAQQRGPFPPGPRSQSSMRGAVCCRWEPTAVYAGPRFPITILQLWTYVACCRRSCVSVWEQCLLPFSCVCRDRCMRTPFVQMLLVLLLLILFPLPLVAISCMVRTGRAARAVTALVVHKTT